MSLMLDDNDEPRGDTSLLVGSLAVATFIISIALLILGS